jgi:hypothetical protein
LKIPIHIKKIKLDSNIKDNIISFISFFAFALLLSFSLLIIYEVRKFLPVFHEDYKQFVNPPMKPSPPINTDQLLGGYNSGLHTEFDEIVACLYLFSPIFFILGTIPYIYINIIILKHFISSCVDVYYVFKK